MRLDLDLLVLISSWVAAVLTTTLLMCIRTSVEDDCKMQDVESCPRWWCGGGASISILHGFPPPGKFRNDFKVSKLCDPWQRSAAWRSTMPRCPIVLMCLYCNVVSTAAVNFCLSPLTSSQGCRPLGCFCVFSCKFCLTTNTVRTERLWLKTK